jgi:hypothetical protein
MLGNALFAVLFNRGIPFFDILAADVLVSVCAFWSVALPFRGQRAQRA